MSRNISFNIFTDETGQILDKNFDDIYGIGYLIIRNGSHTKKLRNNIVKQGLDTFHCTKNLRGPEKRGRAKVAKVLSCLENNMQYQLGAFAETNPNYVRKIDEKMIEEFRIKYQNSAFDELKIRSKIRLLHVYTAALRYSLMDLRGLNNARNIKFNFNIAMAGHEEGFKSIFAVFERSLTEALDESFNKYNKLGILRGITIKNIKIRLVRTKVEPLLVLADLMAYSIGQMANGTKKGNWLYEEISPFILKNSIIDNNPTLSFRINESE